MTEAGGFVDQTVTGVAEPQPMYKALRESNPVFRSPQAVVLSRLADIEMALKHTELFSSNMDAVDLGNVRPLIPLQIDPPEHAKYRRILDPLFTPREMARREPLVTELVNEMIDRFTRGANATSTPSSRFPCRARCSCSCWVCRWRTLTDFCCGRTG